MSEPSNTPASFLKLEDGRALAYHKLEGASPGVFFLPGFKSDKNGAKALALEAWCREAGRACLRFDYTGHGESSGAFEEGTIGAWLQDALDAFDRLTDGPQIVVGSSMGGWLALLLALRREPRVRALVGIAAAPDFTEELIWNAFTLEQKTTLLEQGRVLLPDCYGNEPYPITRALVEEGTGHLLLRMPIPVRCPVRLLHGTADEDVPWEIAARLLAQLESKDAILTLIKDGGHRLSESGDLRALLAAVTELSK